MIAVASTVFVGRTIARSPRGWRLQAEDIFMSLAFVLFLAMSVAYIVIIDPMFRLTAVRDGTRPPYATMTDDALLVIKVFFCNSMLLWFALFSVKLAFLTLYRRLMMGLPHYLRWWWAILGFCIVVRLPRIARSISSPGHHS